VNELVRWSDRVRACLWEAGFPYAEVADMGLAPDGTELVGVRAGHVPAAVTYKAFQVAGKPQARCWTHFSANPNKLMPPCGPECDTTAPPPRELVLEGLDLVRR
jgi:hypothetical protein